MTTAALPRLGARAVHLASRVRGERVLHPRGVALTGLLTTTAEHRWGLAWLDEPGEHEVAVRLSRSAGLPPPLPDVLGLAVRVLDVGGPGAHQDLLLDSAATAPLLRRVPRPSRHPSRTSYGSLLPVEVAGRRLLVGAGPVRGDLPTVEVDLLLATAHGPWRRFAVVRTDAEHPHGRQLRFSPGEHAGGIVPVGPLQQWRARSYPASHVGPDA